MATYCAIADVQNRLSSAGVTYRTDDTPPTTYGDVLERASRFVDQYLLLRYTSAQLDASTIVVHWTATIAAQFLCERRGNMAPGGIQADFNRVVEMLEKIASGAMKVGDIPMRKEAIPVLSTMRTRVGPYPHHVVVKGRSTGEAEGYVQKVDHPEYEI